MIHVQRKGKVGEQELVRIIVGTMVQVEARVDAKRWPISSEVKRCSSMQADRGGSDIHGIPGFGFEVKRAQVLRIDDWWQQCSDQCPRGAMPVLVYRQNRKPWFVRWYMCTSSPHQWIVGDVRMRDWLPWFQSWYENYLTADTINEGR